MGRKTQIKCDKSEVSLFWSPRIKSVALTWHTTDNSQFFRGLLGTFFHWQSCLHTLRTINNCGPSRQNCQNLNLNLKSVTLIPMWISRYFRNLHFIGTPCRPSDYLLVCLIQMLIPSLCSFFIVIPHTHHNLRNLSLGKWHFMQWTVRLLM